MAGIVLVVTAHLMLQAALRVSLHVLMDLAYLQLIGDGPVRRAVLGLSPRLEYLFE